MISIIKYLFYSISLQNEYYIFSINLSKYISIKDVSRLESNYCVR